MNRTPEPYTTQWVEQYDDFVKLKTQWNALAHRFSPHFFYRHEWFDSAWQWCQKNHTIQILTLFKDSQLIGILPLMVKAEKYKSIHFLQYEFLSVPDTQMCDIMIMPGHEAIGPILLKLLVKKSGWDKLKLHYLPPTSVLSQVMKTHNPMDYSIAKTTSHPTVHINTDWGSFYGAKSRRLKKGNNLARNHLQKQGHYQILNLNTLSEEELLSTIQHISKQSWKQSTQTTLNHNGPFQFIQKLSHLAKKNQWLNIWALKLNQEIIAYEYQIDYQNNIYALRSDYLDTMGHLSPGTYLNWQILEKMFERNKSQYYMGPGENNYKLRWQNDPQPVYTLIAYQNNMTGILLKTIEQHIMPKVKPLKNHLNNIFIKEKVE